MNEMSCTNENFVIQILSTQNATWQGTLTWATTQQTQSFRSMLELIRLIDSALEHSNPDIHKEPAPALGQ